MHHRLLLSVAALALASIACGSDPDRPPVSANPGGGSDTGPGSSSDGGGGAAGAGGDGGALDAGSDGASSSGPSNGEFDSTINALVIFEGIVPLDQAPSNAKWNVFATVRDAKTSELIPEATVAAGPVGAKIAVPYLAPNGHRIIEGFTGAHATLETDIDRGTAWLHGAKTACPAFHTYTWTVTPGDNGTEHHVVTWAPSGEPGVLLTISGISVDNQVMVPNDGRREWTQSSVGTDQRNVQVARTMTTTVGTHTTLQCMVRVTSKL